MRRARFVDVAAGLGATLLFLLGAPSACNLVSGVDDFSFGGASACRLDGDCPPGEDECQLPTCIDGRCTLVARGDGVAPTQTFGDCMRNECVGGKLERKPVSNDPHRTATDCDEEQCSADGPSNPSRGLGASCNTSGVPGKGKCDENDTCVECLSSSDCPATDDACSFFVCEPDHRCRLHFLEKWTPVPTQNHGDCLTRVCDGAGNEDLVPDNFDVPDDVNDCTTDGCAGGLPTHENRGQGSSCGNSLALVCNDQGQCVGCNGASDCSQNQTCKNGICECQPQTCESLGATCGEPPDGCGNILHCNDGQKNGFELGVDCGLPSCQQCPTGTDCTINAECKTGFCVDGVCCDGPCGAPCKACTNERKGYGEDGACDYVVVGLDPDDDCAATDPSTCRAVGYCDGKGACALYDDGIICASGCADNTFHKGVCQGGACDTTGTLDCGEYMCTPSGCLTSCTKDDQCDPAAYCKDSHCMPKLKLGEACDKASACESGPCVDGFCCDTPCTGKCMACNVVGSHGTCRFVPQNMEDLSSCVMPDACDGQGFCKGAMGAPCSGDAECAGGNCADGVCCNSACDAPCRACDVPGSVGTCSLVPNGKSDGESCPLPSACNAFGVCLKGSGAPCAVGAQCHSGYCFDGVCCDSECKGTCKSCNVPDHAGTCSDVPPGETDPGTCMAPNSCNGSGVCQ